MVLRPLLTSPPHIKIEVVKQFKYLGCTISTTGKVNLNALIDSARRGLFSLNVFFNSNSEILPKMKLQLFSSMITPILTNCSEIWGVYNIDLIETFYLSFLKNVLCVKKSTPGCFVYGEFGVFPLKIEIQMRVLKYWLKIIRPTTAYDNYIRKIYLELLLTNIYYPDKETWVTKVKDILFKCGMGFYWLNQKVENEQQFLSTVKQRLKDIYKQEWNANVQGTSDNRLYKYLKSDFLFENYLHLPNQQLRISLSKLSLSSHLLNVERGRWNNLPLVNRVCELCNVLEDEFHVFIECPRYKRLRELYIPKSIVEKPSMFSFIKFLKCEKNTDLIRLGKFSAKMFKEHRRYI